MTRWRIAATLGIILGLMAPWYALAARSPAAPVVTLAVLRPSTSAFAEPDLTLYPAGMPPVRLTVDARLVPDAIENVKLPVGWLGSRILAYATASGQQVAAEPLYVQGIGNPRRVQVASNAIAAAPAPSGARLAVLRATGPVNSKVTPFSLQVIDVPSLQIHAMTLPAGLGGSFSGFGQGAAQVTWSPDGTRVAGAWVRPSSIQTVVCTVASGRCVGGFHGGDMGLSGTNLFGTLSLVWASGSTLLLSFNGLAPRPIYSFVALPSGHPGARGVKPKLQTQLPHVLTMSVAPAGGYVALVEGGGQNAAPILQVVQAQGNGYISVGAAVALAARTAGTQSNMSQFFASSPAQAWTGSGRYVIYADQSFVNGKYTSTVWQQDVITGVRHVVSQGGQWAAWAPSAPADSAPTRSAICASPPDAVTSSGFGFTPQASIRQTVGYYFVLRQQAFRMADASCLATVAGGPPLSSNVASVTALAKAGEVAYTNLGPRNQVVHLNVAAGTADETVSISVGEIVYRGGRSVRTVSPGRITVRYGLQLKHLGNVNGHPASRWMITSLTQVR